MKPAAIGDNQDITEGHESTQLQRIPALLLGTSEICSLATK